MASLSEVLNRLKSRLGIRGTPPRGEPKGSLEPSQPEENIPRPREKSPARQGKQLKRVRRRLRARERELEELRTAMAEGKHLKTRQVFEAVQAANGRGQDNPPFFIIGPPKSGTSWLVRTLNTHPEVECISEGKFFGRDFRIFNPFSQWGPELALAMQGSDSAPGGGWPSLYNTIADSRDLQVWMQSNSYWIKAADADLHVKALTRVAIDYCFANRRESSGKQIVGDKTPYHIQYLDEIHELYPDARIVHIIRDGRDQAVSSVFYWWAWAQDKGKVFPLTPQSRSRRDAYYEDSENFGPEKQSIFDEASLRGLARSWSENVGRAMVVGPRFFADRYFEVRYEDLLVKPELLFGEMVGFLGADSNEEIIQKCVEQNSFARSSGDRERGVEDPTSFFRKGIAGDWRNYFTERDKRIFKEEASELLVRLGYERDDHW